MIRINLLEPRSKLFMVSAWRGHTTLFVRQPGQAWPTFCHLSLWRNYSPASWFTVKKVKPVVYYREN